jgi:hypothetical protein
VLNYLHQFAKNNIGTIEICRNVIKFVVRKRGWILTIKLRHTVTKRTSLCLSYSSSRYTHIHDLSGRSLYSFFCVQRSDVKFTVPYLLFYYCFYIPKFRTSYQMSKMSYVIFYSSIIPLQRIML